MEELTHKQMSSRGGKAQWSKLTKEQRSKVIKDRWIVRRLKKVIETAVHERFGDNKAK